MDRVWVLMITACAAVGCAHEAPVAPDPEPVSCAPGDAACHNASWQTTRAARAHHKEMQADREAERMAEREAQFQKARQDAIDAANAAFWCFEGEHKGNTIGECKPTPAGCDVTRQRRTEAGLEEATGCEPFARAMCFNATVTLRRGERLFCFPQTQLCTKYRRVAQARGLLGISDCGMLGR